MKNAFIQKLPFESILLNKCTIKIFEKLYKTSISFVLFIKQENYLKIIESERIWKKQKDIIG